MQNEKKNSTDVSAVASIYSLHAHDHRTIGCRKKYLKKGICKMKKKNIPTDIFILVAVEASIYDYHAHNAIISRINREYNPYWPQVTN